MIQKSSNLIRGMNFGYPIQMMVLVYEVKGQGHRVTECKNILKAIEFASQSSVNRLVLSFVD